MARHEWKNYKLGELCKIGRGSSPRPITSEKYFKDGTIPWIKIADATKSGKYLYKTKEHVNSYCASFSRLLKRGSLIMATSGTLGFTIILGVDGCIHDGWLYLDEFNEIDKNFLYYLLKFNNKYFHNMAYGAAIQNVNTDILRNMPISLPSINEQRKIATTISNYDDLIENNTRRIQLLDSMAKLIYDEWFVKFKFPGHEKVKMIDSELGEIPDGWEVKKVYDVVDIQKGLSYKSENLVDDGKIAFVNLKCFERGGGFRYDGIKRFEGDFKEKHVVKCGDIVVAVTDMTQNREIVARAARIPKMNEENIIISMDVVKMNPKNGLDKSWLFGFLNYSSFGIKMKEFANGVNVLHLKSEPMGEYQFVMPDQKTIEVYSQIVSRIYQEIDNLQLKNMNLAATRDLLLPKLISGELDVSELDIKVSEVEA
jgi:type I restriction enzyme S subunit